MASGCWKVAQHKVTLPSVIKKCDPPQTFCIFNAAAGDMLQQCTLNGVNRVMY